jgi:hypothetical protein
MLLMAFYEGTSGPFKPEIEYPLGVKTPVEVAAQTSHSLDLYFNLDMSDTSYLKNFFEEVTIPYLESAQRGFLGSVIKMDKLGLMSEEDRRKIQGRKAVNIEEITDIDREYFNHTLVTFSVLPELAESQFLPTGFSRRGLLQPPQTTLQVLSRIDEMRGEIGLILGDTTKSNSTPEFTSNSLWRTQLFFKVGGELPKYAESNYQIVNAVARREFNNLLDDIKIDL